MWVMAELLAQPLFKSSIHFVMYAQSTSLLCVQTLAICTDDEICIMGTKADLCGLANVETMNWPVRKRRD